MAKSDHDLAVETLRELCTSNDAALRLKASLALLEAERDALPGDAWGKMVNDLVTRFAPARASKAS